MTEYSKENRGAVWRNEKKSTDKHPDFTGKATIDGVDYYVSAWKRGPEDNPKAPALRFSVTPVAEVATREIQQAKTMVVDDFPDDSIPF